jgi:cytochrome c
VAPGAAVLALSAWLPEVASQTGPRPRPVHTVPAPTQGGVVVGLCDGETALEVPGVTAQQMTGDKAQQVADALMAEWRRKNPHANWDDVVAQNGQRPPNTPQDVGSPGAVKPPKVVEGAADAPVVRPPVQRGTYQNFTERDAFVWAEETKKFVVEGDAIFHDAKKLGSTIAMSCDMCHPNAANTHPETYPKYQTQLQRVALLRDMVNWCLENPVKAPPMADDDPRMRAIEAYIMAQRKGVPMEYGKH